MCVCACSLVTFDEERIDDVVVDELKIGMTDPVLDAALAAGEEVVNGDD